MNVRNRVWFFFQSLRQYHTDTENSWKKTKRQRFFYRIGIYSVITGIFLYQAGIPLRFLWNGARRHGGHIRTCFLCIRDSISSKATLCTQAGLLKCPDPEYRSSISLVLPRSADAHPPLPSSTSVFSPHLISIFLFFL